MDIFWNHTFNICLIPPLHGKSRREDYHFVDIEKESRLCLVLARMRVRLKLRSHEDQPRLDRGSALQYVHRCDQGSTYCRFNLRFNLGSSCSTEESLHLQSNFLLSLPWPDWFLVAWEKTTCCDVLLKSWLTTVSPKLTCLLEQSFPAPCTYYSLAISVLPQRKMSNFRICVCKFMSAKYRTQ